MVVVHPTFENFVHWYNEFKSHRCTYEHARQKVCFKKTTWYRLCHDYERGEDVSKYFNAEES